MSFRSRLPKIPLTKEYQQILHLSEEFTLQMTTRTMHSFVYEQKCMPQRSVFNKQVHANAILDNAEKPIRKYRKFG